MSREHKYQAWHKASKKMLGPLSGVLWGEAIVPTNYIQGLFDGEVPSFCTYFMEGEMVRVSGVELREYTGLHDANGKEIYEGDIVEYDAIGVRGTVTWIDTYPGFTILNVNKSGAFVLHNEWEIIGNIYEHPELLRKETAI